VVFLLKPGYYKIRVRCCNFLCPPPNFVSLIFLALLNKINDNVIRINKESINIISKMKRMNSYDIQNYNFACCFVWV